MGWLDGEGCVVRPANLGDDRPGRGWATFGVGGVRVGVASVLGRVFMREEVVESPSEAADRVVEGLRGAGADLVLVDVHAEATGEKQALGWYLAGRVTAVFGTHTHCPTADARLLLGGTAFVTDVGMTGGKDGVIGFGRESLSEGGPPKPVEAGPACLDAVLVEADPRSGRAVSVERVFREHG